jgi:hypothetical protein
MVESFVKYNHLWFLFEHYFNSLILCRRTLISVYLHSKFFKKWQTGKPSKNTKILPIKNQMASQGSLSIDQKSETLSDQNNLRTLRCFL